MTFTVMRRTSFDTYDQKPEAMTSYLRHYGYHFNRKACEYAVSLLRKRNESTGKSERVKPLSKEDVDALLARNGVSLENPSVLYDHVYLANMILADYLKKSIPDELHMALHVKAVIDDVDAPEDTTFFVWYARCVHAGIPIEWEDLL